MDVEDDENRRSLKSIQSRWGTLNKNMARFAACVQQIKMIRETGKSIEDQFQDALTLYNKEVGTAFVNVSCYNIVKYSPKWTDNPLYIEFCGRKRKAATNDKDPIIDVDAIPAGTAIGDIQLPQLNRPAGTKQSKKSRNTKPEDDESNQSRLLANSSSTAQATERIALHLDRASSSLEAMLELSLLQTDTSRLNENIRAALEADKERLLLRRAACRADL
ncbi:uncharacterized protein MELLADRAFT_55970 [Melampsora larici-populina 98AG31]|uniref:No apical meristem-associated C-terminal domain-containing protein n=1 Tax=Melampsora larici-populina (strain 98AG31 / pathotype 3-4-7) TaxID=747676 RepID=F4RKD0_MELLP|nr:uncharacterized protein MELLADRAFT_55970 [Melampsora larici-populina 98AG31]EGG07075.1 hypothetical protein MELLADRAFT_55970 [Melampsora larici-populina 98AG31]